MSYDSAVTPPRERANPSRRVFVVASSPAAVRPVGWHPAPGDLVIAADGGAAWCLAWGWQPALVIGDMDSLDGATADLLRARDVPFLQHPVEKDATDLELALHTAIQRGAREIVIAGALGGRIDHTLANLALLALPALTTLSVRVVDGGQSIVLVRGRATVDGAPGDTLSLLPFGGDACGVSVTGVYWPLRDADLPLGPSLAVSNRLVGARAEISVRSGALLVIHVRADGRTDFPVESEVVR